MNIIVLLNDNCCVLPMLLTILDNMAPGNSQFSRREKGEVRNVQARRRTISNPLVISMRSSAGVDSGFQKEQGAVEAHPLYPGASSTHSFCKANFFSNSIFSTPLTLSLTMSVDSRSPLNVISRSVNLCKSLHGIDGKLGP